MKKANPLYRQRSRSTVGYSRSYDAVYPLIVTFNTPQLDSSFQGIRSDNFSNYRKWL